MLFIVYFTFILFTFYFLLYTFFLGSTHPHTAVFSLKSTLLLYVISVQNFLILLCKSLFFTHFPAYMKNMFSLRSSSYDLCGNYILSPSKPRATSYGFNSFSYFSAKLWNALPNSIRTSAFTDFRRKIKGCIFV